MHTHTLDDLHASLSQAAQGTAGPGLPLPRRLFPAAAVVLFSFVAAAALVGPSCALSRFPRPESYPNRPGGAPCNGPVATGCVIVCCA